MRSPRSQPVTTARPFGPLPWRDIMDVLALSAWSAMLFRYWFSGKLLLLLHPDYAWLSNSAAIALVFLVAFTLYRILTQLYGKPTKRRALANADQDHVTLLPPSISSALLLGVAVFGMIYTPRAFSSQTAMQRGISETLTLTRAQPQLFVRAEPSDERTVIDWIRLINAYPEPDAYTGEAVDLTGFVFYPEGWPDNYLMVSRFVLTCCAADAYPVGLPVQVASRTPYPVDSWLAVKGEIMTETFEGRRQVAIAPTEVKTIPEPKNPYEY